MKVCTVLLGHVAIAFVVACGGSEQRPSQVSTTAAASNENSSLTTDYGTGSMQQPQPVPASAMFNDSQIAAIANTAHEAEIEQAKLALRKAKDPQVKAFAQMMIQQHGEAQRQGQALVTSLGITPEPTPTSNQIEGDSQSGISSLSGQSGSDFDKAYMDLQVKEHRDVLDMLDQKLIPWAHNADLKRALSDFRPKVADHLQRARELQKALSNR